MAKQRALEADTEADIAAERKSLMERAPQRSSNV